MYVCMYITHICTCTMIYHDQKLDIGRRSSIHRGFPWDNLQAASGLGQSLFSKAASAARLRFGIPSLMRCRGQNICCDNLLKTWE